jgi:hypothetical protein
MKTTRYRHTVAAGTVRIVNRQLYLVGRSQLIMNDIIFRREIFFTSPPFFIDLRRVEDNRSSISELKAKIENNVRVGAVASVDSYIYIFFFFFFFFINIPLSCPGGLCRRRLSSSPGGNTGFRRFFDNELIIFTVERYTVVILYFDILVLKSVANFHFNRRVDRFLMRPRPSDVARLPAAI